MNKEKRIYVDIHVIPNDSPASFDTRLAAQHEIAKKATEKIIVNRFQMKE